MCCRAPSGTDLQHFLEHANHKTEETGRIWAEESRGQSVLGRQEGYLQCAGKQAQQQHATGGRKGQPFQSSCIPELRVMLQGQQARQGKMCVPSIYDTANSMFQ